MKGSMLERRWRPAAWLLATVAAAAACQRDQEPLAVNNLAEPVSVGLEVSSESAPAGQQIALAVHADSKLTEPLEGLQGTLRYDVSRLTYVGQGTDGGSISLINEKQAGQGVLRHVSVNVHGLGARPVVLVFEVKRSGYTQGLSYDFEKAGSRRAEVRRASVTKIVTVGAGLTVPAAARLTLDQWKQKLDPALYAKRSALKVNSPGQYKLNLTYGDADLSGGAADLFDLLYVANVVVGNAPLIDNTNRDAVIAANVRPVNGGSGGTPRPGAEPGTANPQGQIDLFDLLAIAQKVAALPSIPVVGDAIPGRGPLPGAGNVAVINADITANRLFSRDSIYQIGDASKANVYVTNGATLTIQPGTRLEGWYGTGIFGSGGIGAGQGTLIVQRDGRIVAVGTALEPIVFTCKLPTFAGPRGEPSGTRWPGCWGGLILNGNAQINATSAVAIGHGPAPVSTRNPAGGGIQTEDESDPNTLYGGSNDADSSGALVYVRSEFAGARFNTTKERNGITFNAVGSTTTVDYVQVHASLDDGTEYFGGTVNVKHLLLDGNEDDNVDWVLGWRGKGQFIIVQADSVDGDRCIEADNNGIDGDPNPDAQPRSNPTIYNITCVGRAAPARYPGSNVALDPTKCHTQLNSGGSPVPNCVNQAFLFRQNTAGTVRNAVAYRYGMGLDFDQPGSGTVASPDGLCLLLNQPGGLSFRNAAISVGPVPGSLPTGASGPSVAGDPDGTDPGVGGTGSCGAYTAAAGFTGSNLEALYIADAANSITAFAAGDVNGDYLIDPLNVVVPDFRPKIGSALAGLAAATPPTDGFFDNSATYLGALPTTSGAGIPWYSGWTRGWTSGSTK